jgi:hypothetical protein
VKRPIFDAGLGLRGHYDYFGVQPGVIAVDVGLPVSRTDPCARDDAGKCLYVRPGFGLYTSFSQTF